MAVDLRSYTKQSTVRLTSIGFAWVFQLLGMAKRAVVATIEVLESQP